MFLAKSGSPLGRWSHRLRYNMGYAARRREAYEIGSRVSSSMDTVEFTTVFIIPGSAALGRVGPHTVGPRQHIRLSASVATRWLQAGFSGPALPAHTRAQLKHARTHAALSRSPPLPVFFSCDHGRRCKQAFPRQRHFTEVAALHTALDPAPSSPSVPSPLSMIECSP